MAKTAKKAPSRAKAAPKPAASAKSAPPKAPEKKEEIDMHRVLTAEGWKRLMLGKTKKGKK